MALDVIANKTWDEIDKTWDEFTLETWEGWVEFGYALKIYNTSGDKVAEITGDLKNPTLTSLEFETLQQGGCGAFSFTLAKPYTQATIDYDYRVDIHFFTAQELYFSGKIINKPIEGTEKPQTYSGWGYFNELEKKIIDTEISPGSDIAVAVTSVLDTHITPYTSIVKDATLIDTVSHDLVATIDFEDEYANEIMKRLTELAVDYKFGVNEDRKFYFQAIDTSVNYYWHVGKHLSEFLPEEDPSDIVKKVIAIYPEVFTDGYRLKITSEAGDYAGLYDKRFSLPEIVNPFSTTDRAQGTPSTNPAGTGAANLTDGDYSTLWESGTNQASGHYIEIDLGADYENVAAVEIDSIHANAKEYCAKSIKIEVKPDGGSYVTMLSSDNDIGWKPYLTFRPTTAKYIKLSLTGSSSEEWKVGLVKVYQLDLTDAQRWADWKLSTLENVKKRAIAKISNIQNLIMNSAGLFPIKPVGKARIFDRNGTKIDDYQITACKYFLSSGGFNLNLELGDVKTIADPMKDMERRIRENENSGVRRAKNLSLSKGFQLSQIKGTYIGENEIQTKQLAAKSVLAGQVEVVGIDDNGRIVIADATDADEITGGINSYATTLIQPAKLSLSWETGKIVIGQNALGTDKPGMIINDGTHDRIELGKINSDYGGTFRDADGVVSVQLGTVQGIWHEVYDEILTEAATSITISDLDGNSDILYMIRAKIVAGAGGTIDFALRPNNDSGANYGRQWVLGENDVVTAGRQTNAIRIFLLDSTAENQLGYGKIMLWAKSGVNRLAMTDFGYRAAVETIGRVAPCAQIWNNSTDNITSLVFAADTASGFGIRSQITIYKKV